MHNPLQLVKMQLFTCEPSTYKVARTGAKATTVTGARAIMVTGAMTGGTIMVTGATTMVTGARADPTLVAVVAVVDVAAVTSVMDLKLQLQVPFLRVLMVRAKRPRPCQ